MALSYLESLLFQGAGFNKIAMGSAYKGFHDAEASWGKVRTVDQQCGQTWLSTFALVGRFYSAKHPLPALIIPTWNVYAEGTEIETGIDNCVSVQASITDEKLSWILSGRDNTLDHFAILAQSNSRWLEIADLPAGSRSFPLHDTPSQLEASALCVVAVGKPSILNHSSGSIAHFASRNQPSR